MFNDYQKQACKTFKPHFSLSPEQSELLDWTLGIGGEVGEVQELIKHHVFHGENSYDKMKLAKELGDVLWYLAAISTTVDINLGDVAKLNNAKLTHRYNQGAFNKGMSAERHEREQAFTDTPIYKVLEARINKRGADAPVNIIFLGPDGSGKTTISKDIAARLGFNYVKCDYRQDDKPNLAKSMLDGSINNVYDRFYFPDDYVYCTVKNLPVEDGYWEEYTGVVERLEDLNTIIVYIDADTDVLIARSKKWIDDYVDITDLNHIREEYVALFDHLEGRNISILNYDTSSIEAGTADYQSLLDLIEYDITEERKAFGGARNATIN